MTKNGEANALWREVTKKARLGGCDVTPGKGLRTRLIVWARANGVAVPEPKRKAPAFVAAGNPSDAEKEAQRKAKKAAAERERRARKKAEKEGK